MASYDRNLFATCSYSIGVVRSRNKEICSTVIQALLSSTQSFQNDFWQQHQDKRWNMRARRITQEWHASFPLMFFWPKLNDMATSTAREAGNSSLTEYSEKIEMLLVTAYQFILQISLFKFFSCPHPPQMARKINQFPTRQCIWPQNKVLVCYIFFSIRI